MANFLESQEGAKSLRIKRIQGHGGGLYSDEKGENIDLGDYNVEDTNGSKMLVITKKNNPTEIKLIPYSAILEINIIF